MKRIIGVMPLWDEEKDSLWMLPGYLDGITEAGGLPVILPLTGEDGTASYFQLADFYRIPEHRQSRIVFKAPPESLVPGARHRCRIYPVGFFGAEGSPAEWRFTTQPYYRPRADKLACVQE